MLWSPCVAAEEGWKVNQEYSIDTFDEHAPLVSIRDIRVDTATDTVAALSRATSTGDASVAETAVADADAMDVTAAAPAEGAAAAPDRTAAVPDTATAGEAKEDGNRSLAASRPKRTVAARTVDMVVEGVGVVKVAKFSLDPEGDSGFSKAMEQRAARQKEQQGLLYISTSGRQVAGRDYHHQVLHDECSVLAMCGLSWCGPLSLWRLRAVQQIYLGI